MKKMGSFFSFLGDFYAASSGCSTTGLTDSDRQVITNLHNNFRSSLAKGQEPTASGGNAPTAKNMYKLVRFSCFRNNFPSSQQYDCDLESMAQSWANNCVFQHSGGNAGEYLYMQTNNVAVCRFWAWKRVYISKILGLRPIGIWGTKNLGKLDYIKPMGFLSQSL